MIFTTAEFNRHTGIGNKLFPWARAKIFASSFDAKMLAQNWISIRGAAVTRGGIDYSKMLGKIFLFNNFINDNKEINRIFWNLKYKKFCDSNTVSNLEEAFSFSKMDNKLIIFRWNTDHFFSDFELHRKLIIDSLYRITRPNILRRTFCDHPFIGINIRLGNDFIEQNSKENGYKKTSLEWYLDNISNVRDIHGNLPIYIVSDGSPKQLEVFKKFKDVTIKNNNRAIEDLLFLSHAQALMGSGNSSFSAWASFLGDMPTYSSKDTPFNCFKLKNTQIL